MEEEKKKWEEGALVIPPRFSSRLLPPFYEMLPPPARAAHSALVCDFVLRGVYTVCETAECVSAASLQPGAMTGSLMKSRLLIDRLTKQPTA